MAGAGWNKNDVAAFICLEQKGKDVVLYATHANVPDNEYNSINKGWYEHYWGHGKNILPEIQLLNQ